MAPPSYYSSMVSMVLYLPVVVVFVATPGGQLTSSISDVLAVSSHCGSYCDLSGQLVPSQQCGPRQVCCGSLRSRHCCTTSSLEAAINALTNSALSEDSKCPELDKDEIDEDDGNQVVNPVGNPSTTPSSTAESVIQWWWFVVPLLSAFSLVVLMCMCYCVRHKGSEVDAVNDRRSRPGFIPSRANSRRPSVGDFDPNSDFAFVPPAYDTLLKNPPTYDEIYPSVQQSCWIYDVIDESPPVPASRRSSLLPPSYEDHVLDGQSTNNVEMTPEPPYITVIY